MTLRRIFTLPLRLHRIFRRFAETQLELTLPGQAISVGQNEEIGRLEELRLTDTRLYLTGWIDADRVGLQLDKVTDWTVPTLRQSRSEARGFSLDVPFSAGSPELLIVRGDVTERMELPTFPAWRIRLGVIALWPVYIARLIELLPVIWRWKIGRDFGSREVVKQRLGLVQRSLALPIEVGIFTKHDPIEGRPRAATIILPIYDNPKMVEECLRRVIKHSDIEWRLLALDDASPDPEIAMLLGTFQDDRIIRMPNAKNLGFLGTVNRGFAWASENFPDDPVVLLNTDAFVPAGWLSRLTAGLAIDGVASVTPFSNDAEIFSAPVLCHRYDLVEGDVDRIDAILAQFSPSPQPVPLVTGVGFCMALSPDALQKVPTFDATFGRGYGEETDWCQKIRDLGGIHICATNLFVEHKGGASFGSEQKRKRLEESAAIIAQRYPSYDDEVQHFLRTDPLIGPRLVAALSWASADADAVPVFIAHSMGGGAENALTSDIETYLQTRRAVLVLRVGQGHRYGIELHCQMGVVSGLTDNSEQVISFIDLLPNREIIYSCGVGHYDPVLLPNQILELTAKHRLEVLFHDFFPISPSYTLLNSKGFYEATLNPADAAHGYERPDGTRVDLHTWQEAWRPLMARADHVRVFSKSSRELVADAYPEAASAIEVVPHKVPQGSGLAAPLIKRDTIVIGVLGNIGVQKGAGVLRDLSKYLENANAGRVVILGQLDPDYRLARSSIVHGSYQLRDVPDLVVRYGIQVWLIPSIWPETFSFTTHETIATGLPVYSFDVGAQADTIRASIANGGKGGVIGIDASAKEIVQGIREGSHSDRKAHVST